MNKIKTLLAISAIAMFGVQPVLAADTLSFQGFYESGTASDYSGTDTVYISQTSALLPSPSSHITFNNEHVYSGGFKMVDTSSDFTIGGQTIKKGQSFLAWCIDVYAGMSKSTTYTLKSGSGLLADAGSLSGIAYGTLTAKKITELEQLASEALSQVTSKTPKTATAAKYSDAFQLAAWEIMAETSSTLSLSGGTFYAANDSNKYAIALANGWLSNLSKTTITEQLYIWQASPKEGATQDLAVFMPIPEPETYAMLLAGLGLMVAVARRRKRNTL